MKDAILPKQHLDAWLRAAAPEGAAVIGPVHRGASVVFAPLNPDEPMALDRLVADLPIKSLLLPQCEVLCTFDADGAAAETLPPETPAVVFGIRPCDARAVACLDMVFRDAERNIIDPYYDKRRQSLLLIALACRAPEDTCFCTATGGDPCAAFGADILAHDLDDRFLLTAATAAGQGFLDRAPDVLSDANDADRQQANANDAEARQTAARPSWSDLPDRLRPSFESPLWQPVADTCLACGACTYVCPTCHCFDITDESKGGRGRRIRTWDSCQYGLFTLHASGHNPRSNRPARMRQRMLHKLQFAPDNLQTMFCVGCGRCVRRCPVNLDIREVADLFLRETPDDPETPGS